MAGKFNPDETDTWHMRPSFAPKSSVSGQGWICIEPYDSDLPILSEGFLGIELRDGTPNEKVVEIARLLDEHVQFITYTGRVRPEWADQPGRGAMARRRKPG